MRWIYEDEYIEKEQRRIRGRWIILSVGHIRRGLCMCVQCNQAFAEKESDDSFPVRGVCRASYGVYQDFSYFFVSMSCKKSINSLSHEMYNSLSHETLGAWNFQKTNITSLPTWTFHAIASCTR